AFSYS
ncbi:hypothetical protein NPIL_676851, partial [Nephila pilipes]